jgi:hypothetical protein
MRFKRLAIVPAAIAVCGFVSACSYHKTVDTSTPSPVVESAPPVVEAAPPVVVQPAPAPMSSSSTTTTTSDNGGMVERQKTTTYTPAY